MTDFIIYECRVAIAIAVFYIFYRLLLSQETLHSFNRIVLISTAVLSFILPFCIITIHRTAEMPTPADMSEDTIIADTVLGIDVPDYCGIAVLSLYIAGAIAVLAKTLYSVAEVMKIIRNGRIVQNNNGIRIVVTEMETVPFSYFNNIVISEADLTENTDIIIIHEKEHIRCRHSLDMVIVQLITVFQWFNPAIWMLRTDLRNLHEYEADEAVLRNGADIRDYQCLLIKKAVGGRANSVINSFNHSTLKKRIAMMSCNKSSMWSAWKVLYIIPIMGLSLASTARTVTNFRQPENVANGIYNTTVQTDTTQVIDVQLLTEQPSFRNGGTEAFVKYLAEKITWPEGTPKTASCKLFVQLTVTKEGKVKDVNILNGHEVSPYFEKEVIQAISSSPAEWTPALKDGIPVDVSLAIPVFFQAK